MAKKSRKKYKYTKHEFISICCSQCRVCKKGTSPDLCYSELYVEHPKKFIKIILRNLIRLGRLLSVENQLPFSKLDDHYDHLEQLFRQIFCSADLCGKYASHSQCEHIVGCLAAFRRQVKGYDNPIQIYQKEGKKKKEKKRYVVQPYPTFFTNNSEFFLEEIRSILKHDTGNNNKEQDTTEEFTG